MTKKEQATEEELAKLKREIEALRAEKERLEREVSRRFVVGMVLGARRERKVMLKRKDKTSGHD